MTNAEAAKLRLCDDCGEPDAPTYRLVLPKPRVLRICDRCIHRWDEWLKGSEQILDSKGKS